MSHRIEVVSEMFGNFGCREGGGDGDCGFDSALRVDGWPLGCFSGLSRIPCCGPPAF
jgi:hypothetical protein